MKKDKTERKAAFKAAVINQLKSLAFPLIMCALIFAGVYFIINYANKEEEDVLFKVERYEGPTDIITLENDNLKLEFDPVTTQFSVLVKDTGKVWYSNPVDAATNPLITGKVEKGNIQSTFLLTYSLETGLTNTLDNYRFSIEKGLYDIEHGEDYVRVNYTVGDIEREYYIPAVTTVTRFEEWLAKMEKSDADYVKKFYKKYDINDLGKKDDKEQLLADYPILETEPIYVLRDTTKAAAKTTFENIFAEIGYTLEDYAIDQEYNNAESTTDKPVFLVSVIYRLVGDELVVEIPFSDVAYKESAPLYTIIPLPYFGAGGTEDEGFVFVPEGGGGIINFNNGKTAQEMYYSNLYGWDMALTREYVIHNTRSYFNVYGIAHEDASVLCIMEDGVPYASVRANISGTAGNLGYNYVNAEYSLVARERYDVGELANSAIYVFQETLPENERITQRYRFVDSSDYVDMAMNYREYLLEKYDGYLTMNTEAVAPVTFEIVGAVDKVRQIVGIPVSRPLKLTTYEEAEAIIRELATTDGISNMSVKLTGWCNGGVEQQVLNKVKTIGALGNKKDLQSLSDAAKELGVDLYLDGITQYAHNSNVFDGFFSYSDAAKTISKERAEMLVYSDVTYIEREGVDSYYLLHTDEAHKMADNLATAAKNYGTGVSFKDIGMDLSSDFYRKDFNSRQAVMLEQTEKLKALSDADMPVMINVGNDYAIPYADVVTNMNLKGSQYLIIDEFVPFYHMAIHGMVDYVGYPINICGHEVDEILYAAEYGAGLQFSFMQETAFVLQKTLYTEYYGSDYSVWHDRMLEIYNRYNSELGHTFNQRMVDHDNVALNVSCTVYEDGTKVYVNYGYEDYTTKDGVIPARDYKVIK